MRIRIFGFVDYFNKTLVQYLGFDFDAHLEGLEVHIQILCLVFLYDAGFEIRVMKIGYFLAVAQFFSV